METITLKQAIEQAVERGQKISFGTFQTFEDFASYYEAHYLPLLQSLYDEQTNIDKKRLIGFLIEDLDAITNN
jgi:spore coat protein CotH